MPMANGGGYERSEGSVRKVSTQSSAFFSDPSRPAGIAVGTAEKKKIRTRANRALRDVVDLERTTYEDVAERRSFFSRTSR